MSTEMHTFGPLESRADAHESPSAWQSLAPFGHGLPIP
jgi:hypothetical protein